ncbi:cell surface protein SprA [Flavobacterium sp. J49]|uniref:T9SS outer membrane translocon Sov/SprA n=1 Tax=Flavobacterium sp. J49 TaxID=2718534 RepID=UPI001593E2EA|nr:cell surface protein SprA [Flavobacterium sp. J49]MBF6641161.1 cell surface protein SprA [Flavobacterium sp. J49]NIC02408.1 cell surface protein SprA [Flavobacterium sp. J49]
MILLIGANAFSQVTPTPTTPQDSTGYATGRMEIKNPNSIVNAYKYDPVTNRYIYTSTFEGFNINYPLILTPKEYQELVLRESMREYFKKKSDAIDGKKDGSEAAKKDLLPRYYVNSGFFETIFGGNTIDVKPTGSVEMDLGVRYTKQDNPAFSPRNRAQTTFDFDQRISMSLMGKVGTRLNVNANYDTESTFAFQNLIKLEYTPTEDDIIQKIEVGNVSMPLTNSLIRGAQSLFGVKAQLQFGKTTVTGVFSEQKSQTKSVMAQGGGTIQDFEIFGLDYDSDRHFFLSQYFRNKYDEALQNYPLISSRVQITRIEVWVTNRQNRVSTTNNNLRNIIALQDLGESRLSGFTDDKIVAVEQNEIDNNNFFLNTAVDAPSDNKNNKYDPGLIVTGGGILNTNIRDIVTSSEGFTYASVLPPTPESIADEGTDYSKLENARKLAPNEFTFHPQLGYVSLQQRLANDEVLAVAYQYTIGDEVYQVGEFGTDGVDATIVNETDPANQAVSSQSLILKMLKSNLTNVQKPIWNLMMKNIYQIPGAFQLEQEDFRLNILYTDPSPINYITPVTGTPFPTTTDPNLLVAETPLLKVFNIDRLNYNNDPQAGGDGFFDFMPGLTVDQQNGRIIFTTVEPFGKLIFDKLKLAAEDYYDENTYNGNQQKFVFRSMYSSTQAGALQDAAKNKFQLKGRFKSAGGDGIPIGAYNVPRGSVVVTAGGRVLQEGIDYSVNYQAGRVQILDPSLQASNTPIQVSVENNATFGQQTRRFMGINVEHKFSDKFLVGGTFIKMTERPFTQKSNYGQESVNNSIFGFNANYSTEIPFLTRLANKLPNVDTDVPSNLSVRGEIAFLQPDTPKADQFQGESTVYVDDFEGSQTTIDMRSPLSWSLSSVPKWQSGVSYPDFGSTSADLNYGYKRAKLNWYTIDPTIYVQTPGDIGQDGISLNSTRRIFNRELFPNEELTVGQTTVINTLDLTYYPQERGPYNYNPEALNPSGFLNPENNFGGITRAINSTNFEQSNVEYIQFWVMDPYYDPANPTAVPSNTNVGQLYFNLGEISEDVLKDARKQYENGLPSNPTSTALTSPTVWGRVPSSQSLIYAFDVDGANRAAQDVGLDGINDTAERNLQNIGGYAALPDPAADNYQYFLSAPGTSVQERYRDYNGLEGNSPVSVSDANRGSTTIPDVEDINRDNTMNTVDAYYEYKIDIQPNMVVGQNYITDVRETEIPDLPNGTTTNARWYQFKIPVSQPTTTVGSISDFRSIRFMRMFMTGFTEPVTLRFGALDLVRGEWRRYDQSFQPTDSDPTDDDTNFDVLAVNIQENAQRLPIPYVLPPGVVREEVNNNNQVISQNEQSLSLRASGDGLEVGDSRAVFKNVQIDMRQFNKLKMFLHAEALPTDASPLQDDQMVAFVRFGNDFTNNFYQVEIPLKVTVPSVGSADPELIWPEENEINLAMSLLTRMKVQALSFDFTSLPPSADGVYYPDDNTTDGDGDETLKLGIKGNPNFGLVRTLMVGIKNNHTDRVRGEVWFNELRIADMSNKGGMAAVLNIDSNMADFATISATGRMSTIGFGALEEGPNERSREDVQQYNIVTNFSLGKLLPKKWGINLPFNYAVGEETITPEYDPFNQDIRLEQLINNTADAAERENIRDRAIDYTKRTSINFIGVKKERAPEQKQRIYDPENLTLSYSYNEVEKHNYEIENYIDQQVSTSVDYTYAFKPKAIEPFKKSKFLKKSEYWKMLSDFNFNYLPASISFSSNIIRQYNRQQFRQVDVDGIPLDPLFRRNYMFNYQYGFNYNITKALKVNFTAASHNIVRSYLNEDNVPDNSYTIWTDFWNIGTPNQHNQQIVVNYDLPVNKLPFLSFVKSTYSYTGDYSWQRSSLALSSVTLNGVDYNLGNTIQNSGSHRLNTAFNMETFYKYIGLGKKPPTAPSRPTALPKPGEKITNTKAQPAGNTNVFLNGLKGVLTSVKNVQINYTRNEGTMLPGFLPSLGFFGSAKPSLGFVFGAQDDIRFEAAKRGWLTTYPEFNQNYTQVITKTLEMTANVDLFPDFKIDLTANRTYAENFSEQYDVDPDTGLYNPRSPYSFGNFSISTVLIATSFSKSDENGSATFDDFRDNRLTIANRLAEQYYGGGNIPRYGVAPNVIPNPSSPDYNFYIANEGYPIGFGKNNQAVLVPAFLAAYTGASADGVSLGAFRNIPIPNWNVKYSGLMRYKFFKDTFKRFSIQHAYRASYTINSFRSNFDYSATNNGQDNGGIGNFYNKMIIANINLVEQFNPLVRLDFEMKNSFKILAEMKKDRSLSMSFDNNLLTEVQGHEYILGLGYRFKDVIFSSQLADDPTGIIKSDINVKIDFSYRNNKTIVRYLDYDNNQLGGGQNIWSAKLTADYSFSKNLTAIFFYDHSFSKPVISTSFPLTNIRTGFTMRYNFGN